MKFLDAMITVRNMAYDFDHTGLTLPEFEHPETDQPEAIDIFDAWLLRHQGISKRQSPGRPPLHADKAEQIREMRQDHKTIREITETLHLSRTTAYRYLKNP